MRISFTLPFSPESWKRPARVSRYGRVGIVNMSRDYQQKVGKVMLARRAMARFKPFLKDVGVMLLFCGVDRRMDLDNLVKNFLDAGNGVLWGDDRQVVELYARKTVEGKPCTKVDIYEYDMEYGK